MDAERKKEEEEAQADGESVELEAMSTTCSKFDVLQNAECKMKGACLKSKVNLFLGRREGANIAC